MLDGLLQMAHAGSQCGWELQRQALVKLRSEVYRALPAVEARSILQSRRLGIASLRLLPKKSGALTYTGLLLCPGIYMKVLSLNPIADTENMRLMPALRSFILSVAFIRLEL